MGLASEVMAMPKRKPVRNRRAVSARAGVDMGPDVRRKAIVMRDPKGEKPDVVLREATVLPAEWRDPDDVAVSRREAKVITGARVANPLILMHRRGGLVTVEHLKASERLVTAYEIGVMGGHPGNGRAYGQPHGSGRSTAYPQETQLVELAAFRGAMGRLSPFQVRLVGHVVLGIPDPTRRDVAFFAGRVGLDEKVVRGQLLAALDALVGYFMSSRSGDVDREIDGLVGVV